MIDTKHSDTILVVCHGPGRGRLGGKPQRILADVTRDPILADRVRVHETGTPCPDLTHVCAVLFWLGDPLRELYPECYSDAKAIEEAAGGRGIQLLNPPDALSNSIKSTQARLWRDAGVPAAPAFAFRDRHELERGLESASFPVIIRPDDQHTQAAVRVCAERADVDRLSDEEIPFPGVAICFVDTREGYQQASVGGVWERYYHKKRTFVFGDIVVPNHVFFSEQRIVGMKQSTFIRYARHRGRLSRLALLRPWDRATIAADCAFWQQPSESPELMRQAVHSLGLDFAALDYSTFVDGRVIFWEANPYFDMPYWRDGVMPRERRLRQRNRRFHDAIGRHFHHLLGNTVAVGDAA